MLLVVDDLLCVKDKFDILFFLSWRSGFSAQMESNRIGIMGTVEHHVKLS